MRNLKRGPIALASNDRKASRAARRASAFLAALCTTLVMGITVAAQPAEARSVKYDLDIPSQNLNDALQSLALASKHRLLYSSELVDGKSSPAIKGQFTTEQAVRALLAGTNLSYEVTSDGLVLIRAVGDSASSKAKSAGPTSMLTGPLGPPIHLAQDSGRSSQSSSENTQIGKYKSTASLPSEEGIERDSKLEEVTVTGSRIPTTVKQQVQPLRSYTREDIAISGQSTVGDYLNTLPGVSNFRQGLFDVGYAGVQAIQLHGLPVGTTLTLLDGQRVDTSSSKGFFDVSNIPLAAIERIEVLPVGASAVYGADALAGAVNFVLRKNFQGFDVNANVGHGTDVTDKGVNAAWGTSWDRGSTTLIGTYQEQGAIRGDQREPTSLNSFPGDPAATLFFDECDPGTVYSIDGSNLPGLSSPMAAIPAGISGIATLQQFLATAGKRNICTNARFRDLVPHEQRVGALFSARLTLTNSAELFSDVLYSHKSLHSLDFPLLSVSALFGTGSLAATNPYNPFGVPVNVSFAYPGSGLQESQTASLIRPVLGLRGTLGSNWHYEITTLLSRDNFHDGRFFEDVDAISAALASSDPATALNPFSSGAPGSPQLLSSLANSAQAAVTDETDQILSAQAVLRGAVGHLPSGDVQAAIGGEGHQEKQELGGSFAGVSSPSIVSKRTASAIFGEARVPVVNGGALPGDERLALTLAGRYDHSSDYGGKATWQSGFLSRPIESLALTGGYGTSYQAPRLNQISGPQSSFISPLFVLDPFQGNQLVEYPVTQTFGANPNLKPETGSSLTFGLDFTSQVLTGLHASLTWYEIKIANYIAAPDQQTLVNNPSFYPGAVTRAPPTSQEQQQGFLGMITQVNQTYFNFGAVQVSGFDTDIAYTIDSAAGKFTPSLAASNIYKWQSALLPGSPPIDGVSRATLSGVGWAPRWKGTTAVAWVKGAASATLTGRYVGQYLDYQDAFPNSHMLGNTWIFDINTRYDLGMRGSRNSAYVSIGAVNLSNKKPPFSYNGAWFDFHEYDPRGRVIYINIGARM